MKAKDIIKTAIAVRGTTQEELAKKLGYSYQSGITNIVNRKDIRVSNLTKLLNAMDYEVVVKDRRTGKVLGEVTSGSYEEPDFDTTEG